MLLMMLVSVKYNDISEPFVILVSGKGIRLFPCVLALQWYALILNRFTNMVIFGMVYPKKNSLASVYFCCLHLTVHIYIIYM